MWTMLLLVILLIGGMYVYLKIILPKMNEKAEAKQKSVDDNVISQLSGHEDEEKARMLKSNDTISLIASVMNEDPTEGIVSCMERRDLKDVARQGLTNVAGKAVGKLTGIGFKQKDNEENYYLALNPDRLHYLHFTDEGECREHLSFDRNRMEYLETGKVTSGEAAMLAADLFESNRLGFTYEGDTYKFFYYEKCYSLFTDDDDDDEEADKEYAKQNFLFAEPFLKFAASVRRES